MILERSLEYKVVACVNNVKEIRTVHEFVFMFYFILIVDHDDII